MITISYATARTSRHLKSAIALAERKVTGKRATTTMNDDEWRRCRSGQRHVSFNFDCSCLCWRDLSVAVADAAAVASTDSVAANPAAVATNAVVVMLMAAAACGRVVVGVGRLPASAWNSLADHQRASLTVVRAAESKRQTTRMNYWKCLMKHDLNHSFSFYVISLISLLNARSL